MHEKQMSSNDQVGHRRMINGMMPEGIPTKCNCSRSAPSETHRIFQEDTRAKCENARRFTSTKTRKVPEM
jgi:hypothetical protein